MKRAHYLLLVLSLLITLLLPAAGSAAPAPYRGAYVLGEVLIGLKPGFTLKEHTHQVGLFAQGSSTQAPLTTAAVDGIRAFNGLLSDFRAYRVESLDRHSATYRLFLNTTTDPAQLAARFAAMPAVRFAEPNYIRHALRLPNDPLVQQQWALTNMQAFEAWDISTGNQTVIAVLDTGVTSWHADLAGKILPGYNPTQEDANIEDDNGHGTGVAGLIAATTDNATGVAGMCWGCLILPIKVLNAEGVGNDATVAKGIRWATDNGARIMNLSLGGTDEGQVLREAVDYAFSRGVILVAASGNERQEGNAINYPAAYPNVIAVGATGNTDVVTAFSNTGDYLDLAAPGIGLWTTSPNGDYAPPNGTSYASPFIAGAAGLVLSVRGDLPNSEVECILEASADDKGIPGKDPEYGWGRLNVLKALQLAQSYTSCPLNQPAAPPPPAPETPVPAPAPENPPPATPVVPPPAPAPENPPPTPPVVPPPAPAPENPPPAPPVVPPPPAAPAPVPTPPPLSGSVPPALAPVPPVATTAEQVYFPETQHTVRNEFKRYWERQGGLSIFGYPISEEFTERGTDGRDYTVQYFQRHRFEFHPEQVSPYHVQLSRLGDDILLSQGRIWFTFPKGSPQPGCLHFANMGHNVCEPFLSYWRSNGLEFDGHVGKSFAESQALFGQPLSEAQPEEVAPGVWVTVQWFERARFEVHAPNQVLLGLLGNELVRTRGWVAQ